MTPPSLVGVKCVCVAEEADSPDVRVYHLLLIFTHAYRAQIGNIPLLNWAKSRKETKVQTFRLGPEILTSADIPAEQKQTYKYRGAV